MTNKTKDMFVELILDEGIFDDQDCILCTEDDYCERCGAECLANHLTKNGATFVPCKVGDTVYKICPKCNSYHEGSCNHCAWSGCHFTGCDVGVGVWPDGSFNEHEKQIVPYKVTEHRFITIIKYWNLMFFATPEDAEKAKEEYVEICTIEDRKERHEKYLEWKSSRKMHYNFLEGDE